MKEPRSNAGVLALAKILMQVLTKDMAGAFPKVLINISYLYG